MICAEYRRHGKDRAVIISELGLFLSMNDVSGKGSGSVRDRLLYQEGKCFPMLWKKQFLVSDM